LSDEFEVITIGVTMSEVRIECPKSTISEFEGIDDLESIDHEKDCTEEKTGSEEHSCPGAPFLGLRPSTLLRLITLFAAAT
jgi:hypothetical protein